MVWYRMTHLPCVCSLIEAARSLPHISLPNPTHFTAAAAVAPAAVAAATVTATNTAATTATATDATVSLLPSCHCRSCA